MPTEAALATSRIVVFRGTASITTCLFCRFGIRLASVGPLPGPSLAHQKDDGILNRAVEVEAWGEVGKLMQPIGSMKFGLDRRFLPG